MLLTFGFFNLDPTEDKPLPDKHFLENELFVSFK